MPLTARYAAAQQVALKAGELARDLFARRDSLIVEHKGAQNFVSRADRAIEDFIASRLAAAFPGDAFLGEESASSFAGAPEHVWVVDPIDGTHNFLRGLRYYCVSIAYVEVGRTEVGVVRMTGDDHESIGPPGMRNVVQRAAFRPMVLLFRVLRRVYHSGRGFASIPPPAKPQFVARENM